jgi:hypothetical protein
MTLQINWTTFFILTALGIFGTLAIIPYSRALQSGVEMTSKMRILSIVQGIVLTGVSVFVGMLASKSLGLQIGTPLTAMPVPILLGIAAGAVIILIEIFLFTPHLPEALKSAAAGTNLPIWKRFLAGFYGGITEELLMRFFLLSGLLWIVTRVWHTPAGGPVVAAFIIVNVVVAVIFGLGHLPATKMITPITPLLVVRAIVLNSVAGIAFGWIYWRYGLAAAMVSHFCADMVLHVLSPVISKAAGLAAA